MLVVDDNISLAENIVDILSLAGYAGEIAASAEEAIPRALTVGIRFIITDFCLPGLNGAQLIKSLRRQGGQFRAVIISANSDEGTIQAAHDAGIDDFLAKPVDFARLMRVIGQAQALLSQ